MKYVRTLVLKYVLLFVLHWQIARLSRWGAPAVCHRCWLGEPLLPDRILGMIALVSCSRLWEVFAGILDSNAFCIINYLFIIDFWAGQWTKSLTDISITSPAWGWYCPVYNCFMGHYSHIAPVLFHSCAKPLSNNAEKRPDTRNASIPIYPAHHRKYC